MTEATHIVGEHKPVIELCHLGMTYHRSGEDVRVFSDLNLTFDAGTSYAVIGSSGVGKTTLLHLMGALDAPTSGDVRLLGHSVRELVSQGDQAAAFRLQHVGFVFQFHHLLPEFDAVENVAMPLRIRGVGRDESAREATELLTKLGLGHRLSHRPGTLSGGEQQRVAIARALINRPAIVLADEPTGNLDQKTSQDVLSLLLSICSEFRSTLLLVTHSLDLAFTLDQVLELEPSGLRRRTDKPSC